ncbi:MAG: oxygen-independent coproporphyrinogen III oxidase [Aliiglaciecola sp.]
MNAAELCDPSLLQKYNTNGPRYTSYPTALSFTESFFNDDFLKAVKTTANSDLSIYIHIPFCHSLCYYCGCNKIVTRHQQKADEYLAYLVKEIACRAEIFGRHTVQQIHLGGGTPSFLTKQQITNLVAKLRQCFELSRDLELSIEIDPRNLTLDYIDHLANVGFNRLSIGLQDIDTQVQKAINRLQSTQFIADMVKRAKRLGFRSVNLDLIYGLPHQTPERFSRTIEKVIDMDVERISLFSYAHMPEKFAAQRKLRDQWLPDAEQKLALMQVAIERFIEAGYTMIGMDHFAKPQDELAKHQAQGRLNRNFQGYTTHANCDLLGLGVSSISKVGNCYSQNQKGLKDYYHGITKENNAVCKGVKLTIDDQIRGFVIGQLMCNLTVEKSAVNEIFDIDFDRYFSTSLKRLSPFLSDHIVKNSKNRIDVVPAARLLIRNICMAFDAYISRQHLNRYSRVI